MSEAVEIAKESLDAMLGYLGFVVTVEEDPYCESGGLQILTEEGDLLIGRRGERLEDIQYLVNRIVQHRSADAPRVQVDIAHYRRMRDDSMLEKIRDLAERVRATGKSLRTAPLNSYHRRLVHGEFKDDPDIETISPKERSRLKRISLSRRR